MVSEFKVEELKKWLNRTIENVDELKSNAENKGEDVAYLRGVLQGLEMVKENCFDGGLYDLEV